MNASVRGPFIAVLLLATIPPLKADEQRQQTASSGKTVRVAGIVLKWVYADKEANYRRAEPLIRAAAAGGAKIVCTTECFLDGYAIGNKADPPADYRSLAE